MSTQNTFNHFHHWMRGTNAKFLLGTNHFPAWWTSTVDLHGEIFYHHSSSPKDSLTVKYSPFFIPFPRRNDNSFLRHLCRLPQAKIRSLLSFQLQKFVEKGGDRDDWLHHTIDIIVDFLECSEKLSSDRSNFWGSSEIAKNYRQNSFVALALIGARYTRL